jgi:hypothetical protein
MDGGRKPAAARYVAPVLFRNNHFSSLPIYDG